METLTYKKLQILCSEKGYKGYSKYKKKKELIDFIKKQMMNEIEKKVKNELLKEVSNEISNEIEKKTNNVNNESTELIVQKVEDQPALQVNENKRKNHNECLGRTVEYFISKMYFNENVDTIFKPELIDLKLIQKDMELFEKLKTFYPYLQYIGNSDNKYDFKYNDINDGEKTKYVSVKSNFNGKKVCPQVIGQTTFKKYKSYFKIDENYTKAELKVYIMEHIDEILKTYLKYTFHCDIIYYFKERKKNYLQIVKYDESRLNNVEFEKGFVSFSHIKNKKDWNESSTVYYTLNNKTISIGEFQVHNNRDNIKFRWNFDKIVELCGFETINI